MKKNSIGSRVLALLLALVMVVSVIPAAVFAAKGDLAVGKTGIDTDTLGDEGFINWPVKIYDYLNDGMLFEWAEANVTNSALSYMKYGGGNAMPQCELGTDYTVSATYSKNAFQHHTSLGRGDYYTITQKSASAYKNPRYVRLQRGDGDNKNFELSDFASDNGTYYSKTRIRYLTLVYRASNVDDNKFSFLLMGSNGSYYRTEGRKGPENTDTVWHYMVVDLKDALVANDWAWSDIPSNIAGVWVTCEMTGANWLDISHVGYFDNSFEAEQFGMDAAAFSNNPGEYLETGRTVNGKYMSGRNWQGGNNLAYGMLFCSQGGGWYNGTSGGSYNSSTYTNGYYTHRIGYDMSSSYSAQSNIARQDFSGDQYTAKYTDSNGKVITSDVTGTTNNIFYVSAGSNDGISSNGGYDMSKLQLDGYQLLSTLTSGGMTAGLLEPTLVDGRPVYRQETVEYIAKVLYNSLTIPVFDADGDYNYNFIKGSPSTLFGGRDLDGDGTIGMADLNGDGHDETNEASCDLATALRHCLGIKFTLGKDRGSNPTLGTYKKSAKKDLIGSFAEVRDNITTCTDAAYYMLNNLFNANSFNQKQDDYSYLKLDHAIMSNGKGAYVFDAGYSTGNGTNVNSSSYVKSSQSAVNYSPYLSKDADGNSVKGDGIISLKDVNSKDMFYYNDYYTTTRFPFLPVTDSEGDFAGETRPYYFKDDGVHTHTKDGDTYVNRNFNYAMVCNGEFVYHEDDGLFFEFEGDDDVYLFINNQLVLDLGGAHSITNESFEVNDYVNWAREVVADVKAEDGDYDAAGYTEAEYERALALDLDEGEVCRFDFYYMERHGFGANCRIVTNMRITDPELHTEKTAHQFGDDVPYGGVVDYEEKIEYRFTLNNTGNTKLYNLTFEDKDIGVKIDYEKGLQLTGDENAQFLVRDAYGGDLDAEDITAYVTGYEYRKNGDGDYEKDTSGNYYKVEAGTGHYRYAEVSNITFKNNQELIDFLKTLQADGTQVGELDAELTQNGAGLWVDAAVTLGGIYYYMSDDQVDAGFFDNTVYVTGTTRSDPLADDNQTLRSSANHRVYISGYPIYYQWAGHDLYLQKKLVLEDATREAGEGTDSQLSQYQTFFKAAQGDVDLVNMYLCDKSGKKTDYDEVTLFKNEKGWIVNYPDSGTHSFFVYMYLLDDNNDGEAGIQDGEFAIVRVTIHATDVEDSTFVLDYGLKTENLDTYGELFKDDNLLGAIEGNVAKLMAVSTTEPTYIRRADSRDSKKFNRIDFTPYLFKQGDSYRIWAYGGDGKHDGCYTVNLEIPEAGREISYNAMTGQYSLTDVGTVTVHVDTPPTWDKLYLYWWYDNNIRNADFPGQQMTRTRAGKYKIEIPANVPHVIISREELDENGEPMTDAYGNKKYLQTSNLNLSMGQEAWIELSGELKSNGTLAASVSYSADVTTMHAIVPKEWGDVYLYYWNETGVEGEDYPAWPGAPMTDEDGDGKYTVSDIPGNITHVIMNNGSVRDRGKQTDVIQVYPGTETTITVDAYYHAAATVTQPEVEEKKTYTVNVNVHDSWGENIFLHHWGSDGSGTAWPGEAMTKNEDGSYTLEVPMEHEYVIVNNKVDGGDKQTADLCVGAGKEVWLSVDENGTVTPTYPGEFTVTLTLPEDWTNGANLYYWNDYVDFNFDGSKDLSNGWPGTAMVQNADGTYSLNVPNYVTHLIVNDGSKQTGDMKLPANVDGTIYLKVNGTTASVDNKNMIPVTVTVPANWGDSYLYYWDETGVEGVDYPAWPGVQLNDDDGDGKLTLSVPASMTGMIINDGQPRDEGKQTDTVNIPESGEMSVLVRETCPPHVSVSNTQVEVDTFKVTVKAPMDWDQVYLYAWDSATNDNFGAGWPGAAMTPNVDAEGNPDGTYTLELPANATHVIVNHPRKDAEGNVITNDNGEVQYAQTSDMAVVSGKDVTLTVAEDMSAVCDYEGTYNVTVTVPLSWGSNIKLYAYNDAMNKNNGWPGITMTQNENGTFSAEVPNYATHLIVSNGYGDQTENIWVGASTGVTIKVVEYHRSDVIYSTEETLVHAAVPEHWVSNGEKIYMYCWDSNNNVLAEWPGVEMTLGSDGWYTVEMAESYTNVIINNGKNGKQTINLTIRTGLEPWVMVNDATTEEEGNIRYTAGVGNGNSQEEEGFFFTPVNFMDSQYDLWMAITVHATKKADGTEFTPTALGNKIDIHSEVQMFKKITVLPANVVYYEDDFVGISYDKATDNSFSYVGGGSGSLKQSVDQELEYGKDPYYQDSTNGSYSGNSMTKVQIDDTDKVATFTFAGTGFEVIGRTNAVDSGTMMVSIYKSDGTKYKDVPVITEFDNGANGGKDAIEQVPVISIKNMPYDTYTVKISGVPTYTPCRGLLKSVVTKEADCLMGGTIQHTCSGCKETWTQHTVATGHHYEDGNCTVCAEAKPAGKPDTCTHEIEPVVVDATCVNAGSATYACETCGYSYTEVIPALGHHYKGLVCDVCGDKEIPSAYRHIPAMETTYLYIDGVRVFQPMKDSTGTAGKNENYLPGENGAAFGEIHDMIADKKIFVISSTTDTDENSTTGDITIKVSGGMNSWTENRVGMDSAGASWSGNTVNSINDYLFAGPNNEAYLAAGEDNPSALAFYVKDGGSKSGNVQVAVRAIDYGTFFGNDGVGLNAQLQVGVVVDGVSFGWKPLATVVSGTEQYYTIPYTECPYDEDNGRYQIVLRVVNADGSSVNGMVSFSSLKTNGVTIPTLSGDQYELTYSFNSNSLISPVDGEELNSEEYVSFAMIAKQMRSITVVDEDTGSDDTGSDDTGSDNTGSDNTGSGDTGSDNTGSGDTGTGDTGSDNTGSGDTGSDNTGSDNTGSDNTETGNGSGEQSPGTGDAGLMGLVVVMIAAVAAIVAILPKKAFRF